ncbi:MAG: helix-turn-helix transcriptional regulator [Rhizobiaceae bacterium]
MPSAHSSEERILRFLKFRGPQTAEAVSRHLNISVVGARKHLAAMHGETLLDFFDEAGAVGRPKRYWSLTDRAQARFPDVHAVLTVEMIASIRTIFGADGLDRLISERERQTLVRYRATLAGVASLDERVARLAGMRAEEGYMAEWSRLDDGALLLVENHCPICVAARACQNLCRSELDVFSAALGEDAVVERTEHMFQGSRRCAYRVALRAGRHP